MNIVLIFSNNWLPYVLVQLHAIWQFNPGKLRFFLLCDGLNEAEREYINRVIRLSGCAKRVSIEIIDASGHYANHIKSNLNVTPTFTKYTLYRLLLPGLLPQNVDKILYLDADTLVEGDIRPLYKINLKNNFLAAVGDAGARERKTQLGFTEQEKYFNAGVLLMNLREIRKAQLQRVWLEHVNGTQYTWPDQDILNITCKGRVSFVNIIYNTFGSDNPVKHPKIIHYTVQKPWNNATVPRYDRWQKARADFDQRYLKIPKTWHIIELENSQLSTRIAENRRANAAILEDFTIRIWRKSDLNIEASPYWLYLYERGDFEVLRQMIARRILTEYGGIYVHDEIRLTQPIDHLLAYGSFLCYQLTQHAYRSIMGNSAGLAVPDSATTISQSGDDYFVSGDVAFLRQAGESESLLSRALTKMGFKTCGL